MRRYNYTQSKQELAELETLTILPENSFAKMAYEWKNSLRIAAEKMFVTTPQYRGDNSI